MKIIERTPEGSHHTWTFQGKATFEPFKKTNHSGLFTLHVEPTSPSGVKTALLLSQEMQTGVTAKGEVIIDRGSQEEPELLPLQYLQRVTIMPASRV